MSAITMNISLSEDLKSFVDARVKARGFSSTSEYMRDLVRRDEERAQQERLQALIEDGLQSGPGRPWEQVKAGLDARIAAARKTHS